MSDLPTGTVTFLFTDIEGSTKHAREYPDSWESMQARHDSILTGAIESNHGFVFQNLGDSFCSAFHKPGDALQAALKAQRGLQSEPWGAAAVRVRMGIHTGEAEINGKDYCGYLALSQVQRVMSAGHGGQILLSDTTETLLRSQLPRDVDLRDLGEHRLKDVPHPVRIFQVIAPDLQKEFPALRALDMFPNNLPAQLTAFIGRESEITEIRQALDEHRLVTLTGSGGTGKTRLALEVVAGVLDHFDHGVWFVELAPLGDPDLIPQTILSTIGASEQPGRPPLEVLKEYLHERQALIVLDNCEHIISASARVASVLLNGAPRIKILASSREALGVKGEAAYAVPSLSTPDPRHLPAFEQLLEYEAVRLYIDRALLVAPHFVIDKDNASFIAQICCRLDGIPLAIELAAARVKMMSVDQISKRLDDRFRLLTGGARTALPRQQTLRATIDWSYDILSENERLLLCRLSVFSGGWTLEAAEEVCIGQNDVLDSSKGDISSNEILDLLTQLVNKSLVIAVWNSRSGETRYRMLETIRQYAREKLLEAGGGEIVRRQHLAYFVKLSAWAEPELYHSNQAFWLNKLDDELDNIRAAMDWALTTDAESGLRLIIAPLLFWQEHGDIQELGSWLAQLLERYNKVDSLRALSLAVHSFVFASTGDLKRAEDLANQSLVLSRAISDKQAEAFCLLNLGAVLSIRGNYGEAQPYVEQSLALYRSFGDELGQERATLWLSIRINDLGHSRALVLECLKLCRELGFLSGIADCLGELAIQTIWAGDFSSPVKWLEEARAIYRQLKDQFGEAHILGYSGTLAYWQGDYQKALACHREAYELCEEGGFYMESAWESVHMAYALLRLGEPSLAKKKFENRIQYALGSGNMDLLIFTLEGLASLFVTEGGFERAARLFAWAKAKRDALDNPYPPVEQASIEHDLAIIRSRLEEVAFASASAKGRFLTVEEVVADAREE